MPGPTKSAQRVSRRPRLAMLIVTGLALSLSAADGDRFAPRLLPGLTVTIHTLRLDEEIVWVHEYFGSRPGYTFVNLHDDENTSAVVTREFIAAEGGRLVELRHGRGRNVIIRHAGHRHPFDPNRMFTPTGLTRSLAYFQGFSEATLHTAAKFPRQVERIIGIDSAGTIISVHNNTDGRLTILDYRKGQIYGANTRAVHVAAERDPDNYFFTNDEALFRALTAAHYNAALMEAEPTRDLGTLAFLAHRKGQRYVLVEAQHEAADQQREMLQSLVGLLAETAPQAEATR